MSSRKTHYRITLAIMAASIPAAAVLPADVFLLIELGMGITLWPAMTPDLDINTRKFGEIGELIGLRAYAKSIPHRYGLKKRHWSRLRIWNIFWMSHVPFLGTLPRLLMLTSIAAMVGLVVGVSLATVAWWLGWIWVGMSLSDLGHLLADRPWKKRGKEYWIRKGRYRAREETTNYINRPGMATSHYRPKIGRKRLGRG